LRNPGAETDIEDEEYDLVELREGRTPCLAVGAKSLRKIKVERRRREKLKAQGNALG
jgi:hypothetical protein